MFIYCLVCIFACFSKVLPSWFFLYMTFRIVFIMYFSLYNFLYIYHSACSPMYVFPDIFFYSIFHCVCFSVYVSPHISFDVCFSAYIYLCIFFVYFSPCMFLYLCLNVYFFVCSLKYCPLYILSHILPYMFLNVYHSTHVLLCDFP